MIPTSQNTTPVIDIEFAKVIHAALLAEEASGKGKSADLKVNDAFASFQKEAEDDDEYDYFDDYFLDIL